MLCNGTLEFKLPVEQKIMIKKIKEEDFEKIIISNVASAQKALKFLTSEFMAEVEKSSLIWIQFKVNENFEDNFGDDYSFPKKNSLIVTVETAVRRQCKSKIFWTITGKEEHLSLGVLDEEVSEFCRNVIAAEIKKGRTGILEGYKNKKVTLASIGNDKGDNLLILSVIMSDIDIAIRLLTLGFDVDYENNNEQLAIDIAWDERKKISTDSERVDSFDKIILRLLNFNSRLPQKSNLEELSKQIQNFVMKSESLRTYIRDEDTKGLGQKLKKKKHLSYFYDRDNQSLLAFAIQNKKYEMIDNLMSYGLRIGKKENINLEENSHLIVLKSKSKIGKDHRDSCEMWMYVKDIFDLLDRFKISSKILEVVAKWKRLMINFNIYSKNISVESVYSDENIYLHGNIIIHASTLKDDKNYLKVAVSLFQELCNLALSITFMNGSNPYNHTYEAKRKFNEVFSQFCNEDFEIPMEFCKDLFSLCCKKLINTKQIVIVIPLLLEYWRDKNKSKSLENELEKIEKKYDIILKYFNDVVIPQIDISLGVLPKLQDENQEIKYNDLTQAMQLKIQMSMINVQGFEVSPLGLIDNLLKLLEAKDIRGILIDNKKLKVGNAHRDILDLMVIERKFIKINNKMQNDVKVEDFKTVYTDFSKKRIFILADHPGNGKTIAFKYVGKKLKKRNEDFLLYSIKLRKHQPIYDKTIKIETKRDILELLKMITEVSDFESKVFVKLFRADKIIFLFDGFDEICPKYCTFWINIFEKLKTETKINFWISTRPLCVKKLEDALDVEAYELAPLVWHEKEQVIRRFIHPSQDSNKLVQKINEIFFNTFDESCQNFVNNPLILQIIAESSSIENIELEFKNRYNLFKKIINAHKEKIDAKVAKEDQEAFLIISFVVIFQVFSIKYLFENDYGKLRLDDLEIIKIWNEVKHNLTSEMIQRYGFLTIAVNDLSSPIHKNAIKFIHPSFLDFFVSNYLFTLITENNSQINSEITFDFLAIITSNIQKFENVLSFLLDHLKDDECKINESLLYLLKDNINQIHSALFDVEILKQFLLLLEFWSFMFSKNKDMLRKFWLIGEENSLHKRLFLDKTIHCKISNGSKKCEFVKRVLEIIESSFGSDWFIVFSTRNQVENIENELHNLIKLLLIAENDYKNFEIQIMFKVHFYDSRMLECINENIGIPILNIVARVYENDRRMLFKIIVFFLEYSPTSSFKVVLEFICDNIETIFKNDRKNIRKILFYEYSFERHPLFLALRFGNPELFKNIGKLYIKYQNSKEALQKIFISIYDFPTIICNISTHNQHKFTEFMISIFKHSEDKLLNLTCHEYKICFKLIMNDEPFKFLVEFSGKIFNSNYDNICKFIKKILLYECSSENQILILALKSNNIDNVHKIKTIFENYNISVDDLKIVFKEPEKLLQSLQFIINEDVYNEFEKIFKELLTTNMGMGLELAKKTEKYLKRKNYNKTSKDDLKYLSKFMIAVSECKKNDI